MSLLAPLSAALATKAGTVAAAGLAVATATAGIATATNVISDDELQPTVAEAAEEEEEKEEEELVEEKLEVVEDEGEEGPDEAGLENRSDTANRVHEVIAERDTFESGRDFGQAVSSAARGDDTEDGDAPGAEGRDRAEQARSQDSDGEGIEDEGIENEDEAELEEENEDDEDEGDDDGEPAAESDDGRAIAEEHSGDERP